jgi:hypothetical protein
LSADPIFQGITDAGPTGNALFVSPIALDPADPSTLLAGGASLWRSRDSKAEHPTWAEIKQPTPSAAGKKMPLISAVEMRATSADGKGSDLVWVGHANGDLYRSADGTAEQPKWDLLSGNTSLPRRMITRIRSVRGSLKAPADKGRGTLLLTFAGYAGDNLWRSDDDGRTWRNIHGRLPHVPIFDVAVHPRNAEWMYVATEVGVFASADGGATWMPTGSGPFLVRATELMWLGERLVVSTFGRGIFWIDLSVSDAASPSVPPTPPPAPSRSGHLQRLGSPGAPPA